jgi:hypothetical protein
MNITNKVKILCEEAYAETIWCKELLGGLQKELKKRRLAFELCTKFVAQNEEEIICLIGMSHSWLENLISKYNESSCVPIILSSLSALDIEGKYHFIGPAMEAAAKKLKESSICAGRTKIALYGASYSSDLDKDRTKLFSPLIKDSTDIYLNTGNLENCFRSFLTKAFGYDAVICTNGYAAVSLVKKLEKENPKFLEKLVIISCEEVLKHSKYNQWISLIDLNLESYGATAVAMMEMTDGQSEISAITVKMNVNISEIPEKDHEEPDVLAEQHQLYEDPEIIHMAKIEQLLRDADDLDHHIIAMLLDNAKYSDIADSCYMTEGNIKYRVKKYMSICDCKTKKELLELLQEYLQ